MPAESCGAKFKRLLALITVEPTMVLYMMAYMLTSIVEQSFFVYKACRVNHGFNDTICKNITAEEHEDLNKQVQVTVSLFHQWNDIAGHLIPFVLAMFMGSWSDRRGRKLPLLIGLTGKFIYSGMVVVNTYMTDWPVEYIIYTATLPMAFTGADVAIFAAVFAYISDVSSKESRTLRVSIVEVCYLATMPTGIALGRYLFSNVTNESYSILFIINVSLLFLSIVYTLLRLEWRTIERQRPISEANNLLFDYFDYNHAVETFHTLFKWRPFKGRRYLLLFIISMALYTFQRDEKTMSYLYFQLALKWVFNQVSNFRTYQSALQDVTLLVAIPFLSKFLGWKDTVIIMIGAVCHSIARLFFALGDTSMLIYVGGIFAGVGPIVAPVIRSMVSKIVSPAERGKAFSVLAVADNAVPLFSGACYSQLYNATIHYLPSSIFYLTMASQMAVFLIAL